MAAPVVAVVTGFTKCRALLEQSFAPLRALKTKGVIQRIVYVTWDTPEIDPFVAPAAAMNDVELVRVAQPEITGTPAWPGVSYQIHNLEAALAQVSEDDALILKTRPDVIADKDFLEAKIIPFDTLCAPSDLPERIGIAMPSPLFARKIWLPWADANQPFFYEDAIFMGHKRDVALLANHGAVQRLGDNFCGDPAYGWFCHIARFADLFESSYPIFKNYLQNFRYFPNAVSHRIETLSTILGLPFFWHLIVANAWITATNFHIDSGAPGQLAFYSNLTNQDADWSSFGTLKMSSPYSDIAMWRSGEQPGGVMPCAARVYGRLVDDSWQRALFTQPLRDLTHDNIRCLLRNVANYGNGVLEDAENEFYRALENIYSSKWLNSAAA